MINRINVAVLGSTGYVGMELVKLLNKHENININYLGSDSIKSKYLKNIQNTVEYRDLPILEKNELFNPTLSDYVFLALPHAVSNLYVKNLYGKIKIIDLSADFRLNNKNLYENNYGNIHSCPEYLDEFIYGLPEIYKKNIEKTKNIAVPGCYPTSILLPLIPLLKNNLIDSEDIIIDSKSGYSGAGKKFDKKNIFSNNDYNFFNYNTNSHRHIAEIKQELEKFTNNNKLSFSFNPHILPNFRGMMSTIYCNLNKNISIKDVRETFRKFDNNNYFINYIESDHRHDFYSIQNSNYCKIKLFKHMSEEKIIIVSLIDNLIKGAAGQAIQCLNIIENFEEYKSLI